MKFCSHCNVKPCQIKRNVTAEYLCIPCFIKAFEDEVHRVIQHYSLFQSGERIAIGVSGGKDSSALLHCLVTLNERHQYGLELQLLAIDEGITGYRDGSLECVYAAEERYKLPLKVVSFKELYGWTMDDIVNVLGKKQNCTYCGTFRRQALERGAQLTGCAKIATGHNADDSIETLFMNLLRGDFNRLKRCNGPKTGGVLESGGLPRVKPFFLSTQKDVVLYCHCLRLKYFSTECKYSPEAFRGHIRTLIKSIEAENAPALRQALLAGEELVANLLEAENTSTLVEGEDLSSTRTNHCVGTCESCNMPSTFVICQGCRLLDGLNSKRMK